jgi:hypothetical protein
LLKVIRANAGVATVSAKAKDCEVSHDENPAFSAICQPTQISIGITIVCNIQRADALPSI